MISRLWGTIEEAGADSVIVRAGSLGVRVSLSPYALSRFLPASGPVTIRTFLIWSEHQETPTLVGFLDEREEALFHEIRKIGGLGPMKAIRMISAPPETIWQAIASGDVARLKQLKGVGETTARKLISELKGQVPAPIAAHSFPGLPDERPFPVSGPVSESGPVEAVRDVLVRQFGHSPMEADRMIRRALRHNPAINSVEDLFNEVYRHGMD